MLGGNMAKLTDPNARQGLFNQFLTCLDREESLINHRMTWGLQWNIAAFASLFAMGQIDGADPRIILSAGIGIAVSGIVASILSVIGVRAAQDQIARLIRELERRLGVESQDDWKQSEFIRPYGHERFEHKRGKFVAQTFPFVFVIVWAVVFLFYMSQISQVFSR